MARTSPFQGEDGEFNSPHDYQFVSVRAAINMNHLQWGVEDSKTEAMIKSVQSYELSGGNVRGSGQHYKIHKP